MTSNQRVRLLALVGLCLIAWSFTTWFVGVLAGGPVSFFVGYVCGSAAFTITHEQEPS